MGNGHSSTKGRNDTNGNSRRGRGRTETPTPTAQRDNSLGSGLFNNNQPLQSQIRQIDPSASNSSLRSRPQTARGGSRLSQSHHASSALFREGPATHYPAQNIATNSPYIHSAAAGGVGGNDSRISLLSMVVPPHLEDSEEGPPPQFPRLHTSGSSRLSLGPHAKNAKTARAMTQQHTAPFIGPGGSRPRSRTQSSEQGVDEVVTVFSGLKKPPPLDPDLDAFNKIPNYRPLVLAPSGNRLSGLFHLTTRYIEPTAEQLNLDETELTGFSFSFRDYISDRVHQVCDRQLEFVSAARQMSTRAAASQTRLLALNSVAKQDLASTTVLSQLQKEAERSYEMIHDIINDLDRLDSMLPYNERLFANELHAAREYPYLSRLISLRRRNSPSLSLSPHSSTSLRRQIVSKKSGRPPILGSRTISMGSSSGSGYHSRNSSTSSTSTSMSSQPAYNSSESISSRSRVGPYRLPGISRHGSIMAGPGRCLRPRGSRGSMIVASSDGGSSVNLSAPVSPISGKGSARSSFDGGALSDNIDVNTLHEVMTGSKYAKSHTIAASQRRNVRSLRGSTTKRPHSVISPFVDTGHGSYSRSDVSLSREQVIWSPQISFGSSESIFEYPNIDEQLATSTQPSSAGMDERSDLVDNKNQNIQDPPVYYSSDTPEQSGHSQNNSSILKEKDQQPLVVQTTRSPPILNVTASPHHSINHREASLAAKTSPRSPTRRLSLQSGSSFDPSSPSTASLLSPITPVGSPSSQLNRNLNATSPSKKPTALSPQFPSEATRMLKRAIMDQQQQHQHNPVIRARADTCNLPITSHSTAANVPPLPSITHTHANQESEEENSNNDDTDHEVSSFPSEAAVNQRKKSATTSTSGSGYQERISTWSSSSTRTLADGMPTSRVSSFAGESANVAAIVEHPLPSSSALSTLNASAVLMKNGSLRRQESNSSCSSAASNSNLGVLTTATTSNTIVRGHPPSLADLGLDIRSDLERRVRSFSESAKNLGEDGYDRPHSSMGFQRKPTTNEAAAGTPTSIKSSFPWPARTTSISSTQIKNYSQHRASSLRGWRPDKPQPHRLSILNTSSIMEDAPSDQLFTAPSDLSTAGSDSSKRRARTLECGASQQAR